MHGVLLMASAHLRYLSPESKLYSDAEARHLASTVAGLRDALSATLSAENADTVTACSLILKQYAWSIAYSPDEPLNIETPVDIGSDNMLAFSAGLKSVLQSAWHVRERSIFNEIIHSNMFDSFKVWATIDSVSCNLERIFQGNPRPAWPEFRNGESGCDDCSLEDAVNRLTPILRAADSNCSGVDMSHLFPEINHYLLMWPGKCNRAFREAVQRNDEEALLILLCFYLCTTSLASKDFWWVRDRSKFMSRAISEHLEKGHSGYKEKSALVWNYFRLENRL
jgi:hypothetical protein